MVAMPNKHIQTSCKSKKKFSSELAAIRAVIRLKEKGKSYANDLRYYECSFCFGWHLTSRKFSYQEYFQSQTLKVLDDLGSQQALESKLAIAKQKFKAAKVEDKPRLKIELEKIHSDLQKVLKKNKRK
jgi:hypothetical protein